MRSWIPLSAGAGFAALAACVTINVYFPAAEASKAADRVIDDVWGAQPKKPPEKQSQSDGFLVAALDFIVTPAAAQANIDISSPVAQNLQAAMQARHAQLLPYYNSGAVGLTNDGLVAVHDPSAVPLAERNKVRGLVAEENVDRAALYREIARANGHPEWEGDIRKTFAQRWIARAAAGWWVQDAGGAWKRK